MGARPDPGEHAIRGLYAVTLSEEGYEGTASLLTDTLGFRHVDEEGNRFRFDTGEGGAGARVDVLSEPNALRGAVAVGPPPSTTWRAWRAPTRRRRRRAVRDRHRRARLHR